MNPFFSIIIPVYNVQEYLERCLASVINQSFKNIEIILVNDGSTDGSLNICNYFTKYNFVKLITKENGGLSSARNCGLDNSHGEYIIFLDSDDYISPESLEELYQVIINNNADIYAIKARKIYDTGETMELHPNLPVRVYSTSEYLENLGKKIEYLACSPYMVYKHEFIVSNSFRFYNGILHEDELWTPAILLKSERICWTNVLVYYHFMRKGSITQSNNYKKRGTSLIVVLKELLRIESFISNPHASRLREQWAFLFLETVVFLEASQEVTKKFSRTIALKFATSKKTKIKSLIYMLSPKLYVRVRNVVKR